MNPQVENQAGDISRIAPRDVLGNALHGWWAIVALALLGGLVGLGVHSLLPTVYESHFDIQVNADLTNLGEWTQYEQDVAYEIVAGIFYLPPMQNRIAQELGKNGISLDTSQVNQAMAYERRVGTWRFRMRANTSQAAEQLARIWLKLGSADLKAAQAHAILADSLKRKMLSIEACLAQSATNQPSAGLCGPGDAQTLQMQIAQTQKLVVEEQSASRGLNSGVLIGEVPLDVTPAQAVVNQRGMTVIAGALVGTLLAIWLVQSYFLQKMFARLRG
jgi:hypothetical protein